VWTCPSTGFQLYVGDIQSTLCRDTLLANGITHIVNCCTASCGSTPAEWAPFPQDFLYVFVNSNDSFWEWSGRGEEGERLIEAQNPSSQWHAVLLMLNECRAAGGRALIHCHW
jgi:hypothetical protein